MKGQTQTVSQTHGGCLIPSGREAVKQKTGVLIPVSITSVTAANAPKRTLVPEVNLAHLGRGAVCAQSIQSSSQHMVDVLFEKNNNKKHTDPFSQHGDDDDDDGCSDK